MKQLFKVLKLLKKTDKMFPINAALTLLYVAENEPCLKQDMELALDFSCASGSRNTDYLSASNRLRKPGMGFIYKEDAIEDRRMSVLTLTSKGKEFVNLLMETLNGNMEGGC